MTTEEIHDQRHRRNRAICQTWLLEDDSRAIVLDQKVSDGTRLVGNINRTVDAQHLTSLFEMLQKSP